MELTPFTTPADIGGGYFPGLIVPAAIVFVALLAVAGVLYFTRIRSGGDGGDEPRR